MTITNSNFNSIISVASTNSWIHNTYGHISDWDVSAVTNMSNAFANKTTFNEDISGWNMENVKNTSSMFFGAQAFNKYIGDWSMGNVTNTSDMFFGAEEFNKYIGDWNMGNVLDITNMFGGAFAFNQDISGWNLDIDKITGLIIERNEVGCIVLTSYFLRITDSNLIFVGKEKNKVCPVKAIPIIIPGNDKTKAFSYSRLVNNSFGSSTRGYRSMKITVPLPENASGLPGGRRPPPRNF